MRDSLALLVVLAACGGGSSAPVPSPIEIVDLRGTWRGEWAATTSSQVRIASLGLEQEGRNVSGVWRDDAGLYHVPVQGIVSRQGLRVYLDLIGESSAGTLPTLWTFTYEVVDSITAPLGMSLQGLATASSLSMTLQIATWADLVSRTP